MGWKWYQSFIFLVLSFFDKSFLERFINGIKANDQSWWSIQIMDLSSKDLLMMSKLIISLGDRFKQINFFKF